MKTTIFKPSAAIRSFVKEIIVLDGETAAKLPFYADGFPGLVFNQTQGETFLLPKKKKLSDFFLYGQTIKPIQIQLTAAFRMTVFKLYPFSSAILFGVNPKELNDDCFNLLQIDPVETQEYVNSLKTEKTTQGLVKIISEYFQDRIKHSVKQTDTRVKLAINMIVESKGTVTIKALTEQLHATERTLQRQFVAHVGISPKQFAKIIQFQSSLTQISQEAIGKLTDFVYEGGYADQSHFIRDFRKYAGANPKALKKKS